MAYEPEDPYYETVVDEHGRTKRTKRDVPPGLSKRDAKALRKIRRRAHYLDKGINLCGFRVGWTFFIGELGCVMLSWCVGQLSETWRGLDWSSALSKVVNETQRNGIELERGLVTDPRYHPGSRRHHGRNSELHARSQTRAQARHPRQPRDAHAVQQRRFGGSRVSLSYTPSSSS